MSKFKTVSLEVDVNVSKDDIKRIQSACAVRRTNSKASSKKRKSNMSTNQYTKEKVKKGGLSSSTTLNPILDNITPNTNKKRKLSEGISYEKWCNKKDAERKLKSILLKRIKTELQKELSSQKQK